MTPEGDDLTISSASKETLRLTYRPCRIWSECRPGSILASTVEARSIDPTDEPSTVMSKLPRRSSMPKVARVNLSVTDTVHLLSSGGTPIGHSPRACAPGFTLPGAADSVQTGGQVASRFTPPFLRMGAFSAQKVRDAPPTREGKAGGR